MNYQNSFELRKKHIGYAQKMRHNPTKAEALLWERLKNKQLSARFIRQHVVCGRIADFACPTLGIIIEADGLYHNQQKEKDDKRDDQLWKYAGYKTVRFSNKEILEDTDAVIMEIKLLINQKYLELQEWNR